jgi:tetratricopeptide (TPR) repeat protein
VNPDSAEAKALVERAHRLPLGGDSARYNFHAALAERGFPIDAAREADFCSRLLTNGSWVLGAVQDRLARSLARKGETLAAAAILERNVLRVMPTNSGFRGAAAYGRVAADIHTWRALGLLSDGKKSEALREIDTAEQLHPNHLDLTIRLVPALTKAGEKERAEQMFDRLTGQLRKTCADFPGCADAHNQLAWLSARCRRGLDEALQHGRQAVELAPESASYHDTLAEVLFLCGERQPAIDLIRKCLKMPTANAGFYRQQLQRFQTGNPLDEPAEE